MSDKAFSESLKWLGLDPDELQKMPEIEREKLIQQTIIQAIRQDISKIKNDDS